MFLAPNYIIREYLAIFVRYRSDSIAEWTLALFDYVIHVDVISNRELLGKFESGSLCTSYVLDVQLVRLICPRRWHRLEQLLKLIGVVLIGPVHHHSGARRPAGPWAPLSTIKPHLVHVDSIVLPILDVIYFHFKRDLIINII